ncbi:MAG: ssb [Parachlamydiales bacterium]|nr:ssb [Parachlamydiales bacterium]
MNFLTIAGHLGADPEVRFISSGKKVTTMRVATNTRRNGADDTIWWRVTIWGEQFDKMIAFFKKGSAIVVFGELQKPEIFTGRDGKPQISMNITASSIQFSPFGKPDRQGQGQEGASSAPGAAPFGATGDNVNNPYVPPIQSGKAPIGETVDDEVPF